MLNDIDIKSITDISKEHRAFGKKVLTENAEFLNIIRISKLIK
jgi:hypothetical protein